MPNITNLAATTGATTLKIKYLMLVIIKKKHKKTGYNTYISETENKMTTDNEHDKYITTQEFNKLASQILLQN